MRVKKGTVLGGALLITGSCVGAGMLAIPIVTGIAGFFPTLVMFFVAWGFMTTTALLVVEVSGWFDREVNFMSMVGYTMGQVGKVLCAILYLFLFYALLVAYMSASGNHSALMAGHLLGWNVPDWVGTLFFVTLFGWMIYLGTKAVDVMNRYLMIGKISFYILFVVLAVSAAKMENLSFENYSYLLVSLPVLIVSFGFHNVIPSLMHYMDGDRKKVRKTILCGSTFTLCIYLVWNALCIGVLNQHQIGQAYAQDMDAAQAISQVLTLKMLPISAQGLAFFAILTSFLIQGLTISHFFRDGLNLKGKKWATLFTTLLALVPPLIFSLIYPQLFFKALGFAGGICAVVLFGLFPVIMVYRGRYLMQHHLKDKVYGGKVVLSGIFIFALFIFGYQSYVMLSGA
ncbi:tyrosine transporter [Candidatus Aerophobetes bacterium]|uniref:Tyrosine transporter n=1 Tax=Aerophobetes bacterium TaxID=2030807 RepID=A0A2A4WZT2_UNCAE|nr:MAG: tyrosine transporter [Candidatus Aerophobetes bacterium]